MKKIFLPAVIILLLSVINFAQDNNSNLLKSLQDKFNSVDDFKVNFKQVSNNQSKISGILYYKKENNIRVELNNSIIVINGSTSWNYNKKQNKVIISDYDETDPSVFSLNKILFDYPEKSKVKEDTENGERTLKLTPNNQELNFKSVKLWVNNKNLVEKIFILNQNDAPVEIQLSGYKLNTGLSNSKFNFTAPEGSKIIDLR